MYLFPQASCATHPKETFSLAKPNAKKIFLPVGNKFVLLHLLSRAKAVSKKSIAILSLLVNSPNL
jgi:hypothetical protein